MKAPLLATLGEALELGDTLVIVRGNGAIAEVEGGPLRRGEEWLTLGQEPGSHVHIKVAEVQALRYREVPGRNAALDLVGPGGHVIASISFRKTNPDRADGFEPDRLASVRACLGHLAEAAV